MSWGTRATAVLALAVLVATVAGVGAAAPAGGPTTTQVATDGGPVASAAPNGTTAPNGSADASVEAERTAVDTVRVSVDPGNSSANLSTVTVRVDATGATATVPLREDVHRDYAGQTGVTNLTNGSADVDLSAATVTVTADGESLGTGTVDLRYADLGGANATFAGGAVRVGAVDLRGFAPGAEVRTTVGDTALTATYDADADALVVPTDALAALDRASLFADRQVRVAPNGTDDVAARATSVNLRAAAQDATELVRSGETVAVSNPLFGVLAAETYHLDLTTESPSGRFVGPVQPTADGIPLPRAALASNVTVTLAVGDADGPTLLDGWHGGYASEPVTLRVEREYFDAPREDVTAVLVARDGEVERLSVGRENGTYVADATLPTDGTVLLAVGDGYVPATASAADLPGVPDARDGNGTTTATTAPTATTAAGGGGGAGTTTDGNASADGGSFGGSHDLLGASYSGLDLLVLGLVAGLLGLGATVVLAVVRFFAGSAGPNGDPTNVRGAGVVFGTGALFGVLGCALYALTAVDGAGSAGILPALAIGILVGGLAALALAAVLQWLDFWHFGGGTTTVTPDPVEVSVTLVDGNGHRIREDADVVAKPVSASDSKKRKGTDAGLVTMSLMPGTWQLTGTVGSRQFTDQLDVEDGKRTGESTQLAFPRPGVSVVVTDKQDGKPIPDATISVDPDEGDADSTTTGRNGSGGVTVPYSADSVTVSVEHPKYVGLSNEFTLPDDGRLEREVALGRRTGRLSVTAEVDGVATAGLPVSIGPTKDDRYRAEERSGTRDTDERGRVRADEVFVGDYVVGLDVAGSTADLFRTETTRATVREGEPATVTVRASFEWTVPGATRDRIRELRGEVEALTDRPGRDVAFPGYYGSVVSRLLDMVESLPQYGHLFATGEHRPDDVAEALLDAAEEGVSRVNTAMTTKRNVDLFAACSDMASLDAGWEGDAVTHEAYFDYVDADVDSELTGRIERTRSRIDEERGDLTEVEPATEMWEHSRELFQETRRERDPLAKAANALLVAGLLDAVGRSFDRRELRERMQRTVF